MSSLFIQGYIIEKLIKQGGFGAVYLARRATDRQWVAIKILNTEAASSIKSQMQFSYEVSLLSKLNHPYIVRVYGKISQAPKPAMEMEYFESETLKTLILQKSPLIMEKGIGIFRKVLEGMKYLHSKKIIHKDLKPENILVNPLGDVRLIDLSIAEKVNFFSFFKKRTREGTPLYMAPEQIQRKRPDYRTDIFALGATFYELFSGRSHIKASSDKAILQQQLKGVITKMRQVNKQVPYQLDNIILRMLKKNPEERYQSMAEVLFDLNKFTTQDAFLKADNISLESTPDEGQEKENQKESE